jgi:DNA modification methylase
MIVREERIGGQRLLLGDCLSIMPLLGKVDAVVTDPPYGIGESGGQFRDRKGGGHRVLAKKAWDDSRPEGAAFAAMRSASADQIIWGGNYFADLLPASKGWFYWDKLMGGDFADGELAWTSLDRALRKFTRCNKDHGKFHPTQKPVALMEWCLGFLPDAKTILDPFMGSGTTLVACQKMGRAGIGVEIDEEYWRIACERVHKAWSQPDLLIPDPKPPAPQQESFLDV